ncbi:MAG: hypothetical protein LBL26_13550 [Peptococcaceae bacterium]|nr:hypothetical protein [Peptococcaceae bacterium]
MENELRAALDKVRAGDALKRKTSDFLRIKHAGHLRFRPSLAAVCAVFALFVIIGGFSTYFTPTTHIDFDVNPSVGITVNRLGTVIGAVAYNSDGAEVLRNVNTWNKNYEKAAETLFNTFISMGYLSENGLLSATVQTNDKNYEIIVLDKLTDAANRSLSDHHIRARTDLFPVGADIISAAHGHHMTPAKYLAVTELQAVDPTATFEGCAEHSISEIRELTRERNGGHHPSDATDAPNRSGARHGGAHHAEQ